MSFLYVFIGGGIGSVFRYGISRMVPYQDGFPLATFIANILSSLVLGMLMGWMLENQMTDGQKLLLMTGFCGGFSTFSTFSAENFLLYEKGQISILLLYVLASLFCGLLSVYAGFRMVGE